MDSSEPSRSVHCGGREKERQGILTGQLAYSTSLIFLNMFAIDFLRTPQDSTQKQPRLSAGYGPYSVKYSAGARVGDPFNVRTILIDQTPDAVRAYSNEALTGVPS